MNGTAAEKQADSDMPGRAGIEYHQQLNRTDQHSGEHHYRHHKNKRP